MQFVRLQILLLLIVTLLTLTAVRSSAAEPVVARFDEAKRPEKWGVNFGHWEPQDGVLVCRP